MTHPILIIKMGNSFPSIIAGHGDFDDWIKAGLDVDGSAIAVVNVFSGETLPEPARLAGVVITGAHDMVTERANWSERTAAWIPELIATGTPLLGICYGHQLLAHALGGTVGPNPGGGEFGTVETTLQGPATEDRLFSGLPQCFQVQASHFQSVLTLPPGAVLLAASNHDPHQAFCIANSAWGVQFHPEFSPEILTAYISKYKDTLVEYGLDPDALIHATIETPFAKEILRRFGQLLKKR
jgi:GMP synthase (glutamine-hydrolysing)